MNSARSSRSLVRSWLISARAIWPAEGVSEPAESARLEGAPRAIGCCPLGRSHLQSRSRETSNAELYRGVKQGHSQRRGRVLHSYVHIPSA